MSKAFERSTGMLIKTKHFGEIDLDEDKIITFDNGILGFEYCKKFTLLFNSESENKSPISWLQSLDEQALALPVISPVLVKPDYNPIVDDELITTLGNLTEENLLILLTLTVPKDITKMTSNLKAPILINTDIKTGCQVVVENPDYEVKYNVYDSFMEHKEEKGES